MSATASGSDGGRGTPRFSPALLRVGLIAAIALAAFAPHEATLGQAPKAGPGPASTNVRDVDVARYVPVALAVEDFTALALQDYRQALARYATPAARARFAELDRDVWVATPPRLGWSYFVTASVVTYADAGRKQTLAALYNPWADVFLVTAWQVEAQSARLTDAEIVIGDWLRDRLRVPVEDGPLWQRAEVFTPGAFGMLAALSVRALERGLAKSEGADWRKALGLAGDRSVVDANRAAAAALLEGVLRNIEAFARPAPDEPAVLGDLRLEMALTFKRLGEGDVAGVLADARDTLPEARTLLRALPPDFYRGLLSMNSAASADRALMFMVPPAPDGYCLVFAFDRHGDTVALRRIDVIRYASAYEQVVRMEASPARGRVR